MLQHMLTVVKSQVQRDHTQLSSNAPLRQDGPLNFATGLVPYLVDELQQRASNVPLAGAAGGADAGAGGDPVTRGAGKPASAKEVTQTALACLEDCVAVLIAAAPSAAAIVRNVANAFQPVASHLDVTLPEGVDEACGAAHQALMCVERLALLFAGRSAWKAVDTCLCLLKSMLPVRVCGCVWLCISSKANHAALGRRCTLRCMPSTCSSQRTCATTQQPSIRP